MLIEQVQNHVQDMHRVIEVMLGNCTTPADREFLFKRQAELIDWIEKFDTRHWMLKEDYYGQAGANQASKPGA